MIEEDAVRLLRVRIAQTGLSQVEFARTVVFRHTRTVTRWLTGDSPIPIPVRDWLSPREWPG